MVELVIRLVVSLAIVVGLLVLLARVSGRRFNGGSRSLVKVLHRQPLSRTTAVAVVTVGARVLVLGTTEHQVSLLAELSPEEAAAALPVTVVEDGPVPAAGLPTGPAGGDPAFERQLQDALSAGPHEGSGTSAGPSRLAGSLFAPQTWRDALVAAKGRGR